MFGLKDNKQLNAIIYTRVSTQNQVDKGYGLDAQLDQCRRICELKRYNIVNEYSDEGISGTTEVEDRPAFSELLHNIKNNEIDIIVIYCFDRLARNARILLTLVNNLDKTYGVSVLSCKEDVDTTTPNGKFFLTVFAGVSELELNTITTRMMMGKNQKRLESGYVGGPLPYGYFMSNDKTIEINNEQVKTIEKIYYLCNFDQSSMRGIAKILNRDNILSPRGKKWSGKSIKCILNNKEKYEGGIINGNQNNVRWPRILKD